MNQSGFSAQRQTKDNILYLIQKCQEGFNREKKIYKLACLKVPYYLITIIWAFLSERTFL